ncbi:MAG: glucose-1-phosphate cytidylyltransferase [Candidatus Omnitrophica bacterium]|nr:glucose-1-phosphate cytidylyltransferase [Candidatus Omnitrophota bacterium]
MNEKGSVKVVILAGGLGTRLAEETEVKPKPMVEVGERPLLWHLMRYYAHYGFKEFYIALGYKGEVIKRFFHDYYILEGDMTINLREGRMTGTHEVKKQDWMVHLIDTGIQSMTGGRLKRLEPQLKNATFMMTYGDGLSNVNLKDLLTFHRSHGKLATVTAVRPPARFGGLEFKGDQVIRFTEKPQIGEGWINGGFFVFEPEVFSYIEGDNTYLEANTLERLAKEGQLMAFRHDKFWQCMDTLRDKRILEKYWAEGAAPWKVWGDE